ncbi:MAG TPA: hypothetical protein VNI58_05005 [Mariprofundaceae bacterium]|nr:hypothetical protein [Mariprofundaceae bacterium]
MRIRLKSFRPELLFVLLGRLLLIVLTNEVLIMFSFQKFGLDSLPQLAVSILDGVLLTVLSTIPIYFWIIVPILRERRRTDEMLQLLATLTQDEHEAIRLPDGITSIGSGSAFPQHGVGLDKIAVGEHRC